MPLPKDMSKCMSKVKKEFPEGRSDKKMSKKQAHKQHVAMCLNTKEGLDLTFKDFLIVESDGDSATMIKQAIANLQRRGDDVTFDAVANELGVDERAVKQVVRVLSLEDPEIIKVFYPR